MPRETYLYLATLHSTGSSSAPMRRTWVAGIHKLAIIIVKFFKKCGISNALNGSEDHLIYEEDNDDDEEEEEEEEESSDDDFQGFFKVSSVL
jgi:hypothetical protein